MKPSFFPLTAILCLSIIPALSLMGCGGSKDSTVPGINPLPGASSGIGRATLTILWSPLPEEASRLIPRATRSLRVLLRKSDGVIVAERTVLRPTGQNETTETFDGLPLENLHVVATAHPSENGSGVPQAQAEALVTIKPDENAPIRIRLQSTITRLEVVAGKAEAKVGEAVNIAVSAKNSAGELVMISPETQEWTVTGDVYRNEGAFVTGIQVGKARIEIKETESGQGGFAEIRFTRSADYSIREIVLPEGYDACRPTGLTNDGYVVGYCSPEGQLPKSFSWKASTGKVTPLPTPPGYSAFVAVSVNESKQIVGDGWLSTNGSDSGFLLQNESQFTRLQKLSDLPNNTTDINDRGEIIGTVVATYAQLALWKADGTGKILDNNSDKTLRAFSINNQGLIAGFKNDDATIWYTDGRPPTELSGPVLQTSQASRAYCMTEKGKIVGQFTAGGNLITWENPTSLARFYSQSGMAGSRINGVNSREEIIGFSTVTPGAKLCKNGLIKDLSALIPPTSALKIIEPTRINDASQIVGTAEKNGKKTMFFLTLQAGTGNLKVGVK